MPDFDCHMFTGMVSWDVTLNEELWIVGMEKAQGESREHFDGVLHVLTKNGDLPFFALGFQFLQMFLFSVSSYFTVSVKMTLIFLQSITYPIFYVHIVR